MCIGVVLGFFFGYGKADRFRGRWTVWRFLLEDGPVLVGLSMEKSLAFTCNFLVLGVGCLYSGEEFSLLVFRAPRSFPSSSVVCRRVAGYEILDSVGWFGKSGCARPIGREEGSL
jgi:hypothetical protein